METKQCLKCETVKPIKSFRKVNVNADGRNHFCKECALVFPKHELCLLGNKICSICKVDLPRSAYHATNPGYLLSYCSECSIKHKKEYRVEKKNDKSHGTKVCLKCHEEKTILYFRKTRQNKDGRNHYCCQCSVKYPKVELFRLGDRVCLHCHKEVPRANFRYDPASLKLTGRCNECTSKLFKENGKYERRNNSEPYLVSLLAKSIKMPIKEFRGINGIDELAETKLLVLKLKRECYGK